jgi:glycosyltransferase involved in cell wall biosynthesis
MQDKYIAEILPLLSGLQADGPSYSVVRLCESLILANCNCTLVNSPPNFLKRFDLGFGPQRLCRSPQMYKWLEQLAKTKQLGLIHSHGLWTIPNIYHAPIGKQFGIPNIVSPRGSLASVAFKSGSVVKRFFWQLYQKKALEAATVLHATATSEYLDIRKMGFSQPIAVIPNGIDIPELLPVTKTSSRTLLFLARINPIKGLDMLLPAWQAVMHKFPDWQLQIVGPDSRGYLATIQQMASTLKLERIKFCGLLSGQDKLRAYQSAELFILPSYSENFSVSIAEALGCGIPVITTKGTPWSGLQDHKAGWWVDANIEALVGVLEDALKLPATDLSEMGGRGKAWMINDFSWQKIGHMMKATYDWVINGGTPPPWVYMD